MSRQKRIEKNLLKDLAPYEYTVLKALIDLYPMFRVKEEGRAEYFDMLVPKDLARKLTFKESAFQIVLNNLESRGYLINKRLIKGKGIAVGIDFIFIDQYADGPKGVLTWRRLLKKAVAVISRFMRRVGIKKQG